MGGSMQELQEILRVIFLFREEGFVSMFGGNHGGYVCMKISLLLFLALTDS
jgi:hypothetical protein